MTTGEPPAPSKKPEDGSVKRPSFLGRHWGKILLLFLLIVLLVVGGLSLFAYRAIHAPGPLAEDSLVLIPKGAGRVVASAQLDRAGAIADPRFFDLLARYEKLRLRAGEFRIPAHASLRQVVNILAHGKVVPRKLTVAEGLASAQVVPIVAAAPMLDGELVDTPAEGSLLPETYFYVYGDSRADVIQRMQTAMAKEVARAWDMRPPDSPLNSPQDLVILASIVEKETGVPSERGLVAAVFLNRLKLGMKLQSDPTIIYGITKGLPLGRAITRSDLDTATDYNTYVIPGLPPGPIANPGRASLEAVVKPENSDALYFVADGTGGHAFARTLEEHNRNVARWRKIERDGGGNGR